MAEPSQSITINVAFKKKPGKQAIPFAGQLQIRGNKITLRYFCFMLCYVLCYVFKLCYGILSYLRELVDDVPQPKPLAHTIMIPKMHDKQLSEIGNLFADDRYESGRCISIKVMTLLSDSKNIFGNILVVWKLK
jgi:hypothetical protein